MKNMIKYIEQDHRSEVGFEANTVLSVDSYLNYLLCSSLSPHYTILNYTEAWLWSSPRS